MRRKTLHFWSATLVALACLWGTPSLAVAPTAEECVGMEGFEFSLPSTQERLVRYGHDYYGRHHFVLTFFPAAFTPV